MLRRHRGFTITAMQTVIQLGQHGVATDQPIRRLRDTKPNRIPDTDRIDQRRRIRPVIDVDVLASDNITIGVGSINPSRPATT